MWALPVFSVAVGVVMLAGQAIGGSPTGGLISLAIMTGFALLVLLGGRSETIRGLRGDGSDGSFRQIDIPATAFAGLAVITAIIVAFILDVACGHDGQPYSWLGAIAGLAYVAAVIALRVRG
jgi:hypothetical protein